jgi:hypothetical protein
MVPPSPSRGSVGARLGGAPLRETVNPVLAEQAAVSKIERRQDLLLATPSPAEPDHS